MSSIYGAEICERGLSCGTICSFIDVCDTTGAGLAQRILKFLYDPGLDAYFTQVFLFCDHYLGLCQNGSKVQMAA